jgi:hypothetical protein
MRVEGYIDWLVRNFRISEKPALRQLLALSEMEGLMSFRAGI